MRYLSEAQKKTRREIGRSRPEELEIYEVEHGLNITVPSPVCTYCKSTNTYWYEHQTTTAMAVGCFDCEEDKYEKRSK